jgi:hypothetical protein
MGKQERDESALCPRPFDEGQRRDHQEDFRTSDSP